MTLEFLCCKSDANNKLPLDSWQNGKALLMDQNYCQGRCIVWSEAVQPYSPSLSPWAGRASAESKDGAALEHKSPGKGQRPQLCTANMWGAGLAPGKCMPSLQTSCSTHKCSTPNITALLYHVSLLSSQPCKERDWAEAWWAYLTTENIIYFNWLKK